MDDPAAIEFLRLAERYRRMSDGELLVLIPQISELTPMAQEALANEIQSRGLKAETENEETSATSRFKASQFKTPHFEPSPAFLEHESPKFGDSADYDSSGLAASEEEKEEDEYDEDRKLVALCTVWSERDALKLQTILDGAGIPFFMGKEKATGVDRVTSNFSVGISVQIMQIGMPWAMTAMQHYEPEDNPTPKEIAELDDLSVRCPKCQSSEVIFEGRTSGLTDAKDESSQKFEWSCDSCGHHWVDDGVEKEE